LAVQGLDVHVTLLGDHGVSPPLCEETIPRSHPRGGTLFIPVSGILLHAHRQSRQRGLYDYQPISNFDHYWSSKNDPHLFMTVRFRVPGSAQPWPFP
jgi:hypothetical protein